MKKNIKILIWALTIICNSSIVYSQSYNLEIAWSTYFGDEGFKFSDTAIDSEGNIYFVGFLDATNNFNTTSGSFQPIYGGGS
ncbi:MAG TPA: hypothetical protein VFM72_08970, partial [Aequorivita sp.]|nr:hypothetical protein [Aequorivita sp.]